LIFDAGIKRKVAKGKRRKERPGSPWAEKIVKGMIVRGMKSKDSFRLIPPRIIQEGRTMDWERVRLPRGEWRPGKHILDRKGGAGRAAQRPGRSRSPDIPELPFGATMRAHWRILAQRAEFVQPMVEIFFVMRNPCKH
jgi:hypothetical protein